MFESAKKNFSGKFVFDTFWEILQKSNWQQIPRLDYELG